ncbi:hypothetical protein VTN31DRAFT_66 [Thermomyces dupontii]|uniref:uncharacterized protein n=1 Tax=Talaromyces thermophilus TaxID=28565 RepID=UPI0037429D5A
MTTPGQRQCRLQSRKPHRQSRAYPAKPAGDSGVSSTTTLDYFSKWYCAWFGAHFNAHIVQPPFGLVLKWTDRTSLGEVAAMQRARAAGIPSPKFRAAASTPLNSSSDPLDAEAEESPGCMNSRRASKAMRIWSPPSQDAICSPIGTALHSARVPDHVMGPFKAD